MVETTKLMPKSHLFVGTIELDDLRLVCGDDDADAEEEIAGDLVTIL